MLELSYREPILPKHVQQIVQLFLFSLCYVDLYIKISVDLVLEGIEFVLQLNHFLLLRVNKDILD